MLEPSCDESSRLEKIAHQKNNLDVVSYSYTHDNNGNRNQMNVISPITEALAQVNYTYDSVNQLMSATKNVTSSTDESFIYDNLGNRLKKNNQPINNVFDNNNRIVEDDKFFYGHDNNGNITKKVTKTNGYTFKYVWDAENRLQFVTEHNIEAGAAIKTHTYMYDALGRRILKDSNGVVRKYIYDNEDILFEFDNADNLQAKFTHGPGIDEPLEMIRSNQNYFYHADGLGSITALTNAAGNVVQSYSYNSFGETKVYSGTGTPINPNMMIMSPYGDTAREWDYETGQYFYRARYYDPRTGRFIQEDKIGFEGGDANLYRNVGNNPVNFVDPNGEQADFMNGAIAPELGVSIFCTFNPKMCPCMRGDVKACNAAKSPPKPPKPAPPKPPMPACNPKLQSCPKEPEPVVRTCVQNN